jgi:hypothetical protein
MIIGILRNVVEVSNRFGEVGLSLRYPVARIAHMERFEAITARAPAAAVAASQSRPPTGRGCGEFRERVGDGPAQEPQPRRGVRRHTGRRQSLQDCPCHRSGLPRLHVVEVSGDLFEQPAAALVNPWNRHFVPRHLLPACGASAVRSRGAQGRHRGEFAQAGTLGVGEAVVTGPRRL